MGAMTRTLARTLLSRLVAADREPVLTQADLDRLLDLAVIADAGGHPRDTYEVWEASTAYAVGQRVIPVVANGHAYRCTAAGTSGSTEPVWPTEPGGTTTDGTATWVEDGAALWVPTYDLHYAAAEGWRWKAGLLAGKFDVALGGGKSFARSQQVQHCERLATYHQQLSTVGHRSVQVRSK
jgi:hypothetical protein